MAAVAGGIAEAVGRDLFTFIPEVIVENGGDIFARIKQTGISVYTPGNHLSPVKLRWRSVPTKLRSHMHLFGNGCHSISFGKADAVLVLSPDTALADAAATAIGNTIKTAADIDAGLEHAQNIEGLTGTMIIKGDRIGLQGNIKLVSV
jgi:ApbE superfamily uncharacterized protein (UPF0280 family)